MTQVNIKKYNIDCKKSGEKKKKKRSEQGSNLRGNIPLDFESNALTTRPSLQLSYWSARLLYPFVSVGQHRQRYEETGYKAGGAHKNEGS